MVICVSDGVRLEGGRSSSDTFLAAYKVKALLKGQDESPERKSGLWASESRAGGS